MAAKIGNYKIPFDKNGNQMDYEVGRYEGVNGTPSWKYVSPLQDNFVFEDELEFVNYGRGRSSVTFTMKRKSNGKTVSMFVSDFSAIVPKMVQGKVSGAFTFVKKGANYGCKLIE